MLRMDTGRIATAGPGRASRRRAFECNIRRPKDKGVTNKSWRPADVEAFMTATRKQKFGSSGLRTAVVLGYYGGL